jgi:hypothetical protein
MADENYYSYYYYDDDPSFVYEIDMETGDTTDVLISNSVTSICDFCFVAMTSLTRILLPDSVRVIGYCAFRECSSLAVIRLPKNTTFTFDSRGRNRMFDGCTALTKIEIPRIALTVWPHYLEQFNDDCLFSRLGLSQVGRNTCSFSFLRLHAPQLFEDRGGHITARVPRQGRKRQLQQERKLIAP